MRFLAIICLWLAACTAAPTPQFHADSNPKLLSEWGQLYVENTQLKPSKTVHHYELQTPLFSDYAQKYRTVWMPEGTSATYHPTDTFDFPVGTVITKTFYYDTPPTADGFDGRVIKGDPDTDARMNLGRPVSLENVHLIETRILAHRNDGWVALPYVWNEEQTDAVLKRTGDLISLTLEERDTHTDFAYQVPNTNQCAGCHATDNTTRKIKPIGPKRRHLAIIAAKYGDPPHPTPLIMQWSDDGLLKGLPDNEQIWPPVKDMQDWNLTQKKARQYLDINCAHCHNPKGPADTSGLHLTLETPLGPHLGLCKPPIAAGRGTGDRKYGIVPGDPDKSILHYRMVSNKADIMMPELGRSLIDKEGVKLIADWIEAMEPSCQG